MSVNVQLLRTPHGYRVVTTTTADLWPGDEGLIERAAAAWFDRNYRRGNWRPEEPGRGEVSEPYVCGRGVRRDVTLRNANGEIIARYYHSTTRDRHGRDRLRFVDHGTDEGTVRAELENYLAAHNN